jgi:hypothetical protein
MSVLPKGSDPLSADEIAALLVDTGLSAPENLTALSDRVAGEATLSDSDPADVASGVKTPGEATDVSRSDHAHDLDLSGFVAPADAGIALETDADFASSVSGNFTVTAAAVQIAETGGGWSIGGSGSGSVYDGDGLAPADRAAIPTQVTTVSVADFNALRTSLIAFGLILDGD